MVAAMWDIADGLLVLWWEMKCYFLLVLHMRESFRRLWSFLVTRNTDGIGIDEILWKDVFGGFKFKSHDFFNEFENFEVLEVRFRYEVFGC